MLTYDQLTRVIQLLKHATNRLYDKHAYEEARTIGYIIRDTVKYRSERYRQEHGHALIGDKWRRRI